MILSPENYDKLTEFEKSIYNNNRFSNIYGTKRLELFDTLFAPAVVADRYERRERENLTNSQAEIALHNLDNVMDNNILNTENDNMANSSLLNFETGNVASSFLTGQNIFIVAGLAIALIILFKRK